MSLKPAKPPTRVTCDVCHIDITKSIQLWCAECEDLVFCFSCFQQAKIPDSSPCAKPRKRKAALSHRLDHNYKVQDNLVALHPLQRGWSADDEINLLDGVEKLGFGNWRDIAEYIHSARPNEVPRSANHVFEHYMDVYVHTMGRIPKPSITADDLAAEKKQAEIYVQRSEIAKRLPGSGMHGYMPLRGDFEVEYLNDAEQVISHLAFDDFEVQAAGCDMLPKQFKNLSSSSALKNSTPATQQTVTSGGTALSLSSMSSSAHLSSYELKIKVLQNYNKKMDARYMRKQFVIERSLLNFDNITGRKLSSEDRELFLAMRPLARFSSAQDHDRLLQSMFEERRLRNEIRHLQILAARGCRTLADVATANSLEKQNYTEQQQQKLSQQRIKRQRLLEESLNPISPRSIRPMIASPRPINNIPDQQSITPYPVNTTTTTTSATTTTTTTDDSIIVSQQEATRIPSKESSSSSI